MQRAMPAPADLRPTASGTLAKTPLAHLLVFIADKKLDGSLILRETRGGESIVAFVQGAPGRVKTSFPSAPLGRVLVQLGLVDQATADAAAAQVAASGEPIGEHLLSLGKIDQARLVAALREQVMRRMIRLFEQLGDDTSYEFHAGVNLLEGWGGPVLTPIDPLRVLWEGINARPNDPRIDPTLARLGNAPVRIQPSAELQQFGFGPPELMLIDLLRAKPMSIDDLVARAVLPIRQTKLLAYALLITRSIGVMSAPAPATVPSVPSPAPAPAPVRSKLPSAPGDQRTTAERMAAQGKSRPPADLDAFREEIRLRATRVEQETFFAILGVAEDAPPDVVRSAYFQLAKKWHPDRLPAALADLRDDAARVFARMSEAHSTLTDVERRKKYVDMLKSGAKVDEEQVRVQRVIDATLDFQKAEVFAKKRDFAKAEELAERAMNADPDQADYIALYAWAKANRPERMAAKDFGESISLLSNAIAKEPRCERARFYRGTLLKMIGKEKAAIADFREAAELNPRNIDAVREVRLYEMRSAGGRPPSTSPPEPRPSDRPVDWKHDGVGQIFGRLFKKK
jgi:curved DNA-binding protein CbpA